MTLTKYKKLIKRPSSVKKIIIAQHYHSHVNNLIREFKTVEILILCAFFKKSASSQNGETIVTTTAVNHAGLVAAAVLPSHCINVFHNS